MKPTHQDYYRKNYLRILDQNEKLEAKLSELGWFVCECGELYNSDEEICKDCIRKHDQGVETRAIHE